MKEITLISRTLLLRAKRHWQYGVRWKNDHFSNWSYDQLGTQIHLSIPQYDKYKVLLKTLSVRYPFCVSMLTFCDSGPKSGLSYWIFVDFGVVITLQVNANDIFATYYHVLYVFMFIPSILHIIIY